MPLLKTVKKKKTAIVAMCTLLGMSACVNDKTSNVDVLIVGGGASGVTAGLQSARMDVETLILEETPWLGGMLTSAGVSAIDGNHRLPAGLWSEFRDSLRVHYGGADALETGWVSATLFEPSVGNRIFHNMVAKEPNLTVEKEAIVSGIKKTETGWAVTYKQGEDEKTISCKVLIDATELGDVAKACGVGYDIGMESREATGESIAPEAANNIVQDLTYVAVLKDYGEPRLVEKPAGYDATNFACACVSAICKSPKEANRVWSPEEMITYGKLPNNKYMINWPIEGNDYYVNLIDMSREEREAALEKAKNYTQQFVYYLQNELGMTNLSYADDEFPTEDGFPFIPYHRESRRIHGAVRFDLNDAQSPYGQEDALYRTSIAVGDYPVDHHHQAYHEAALLPNLYFYPIPSYGLPVGTLIPQKVDDLIVAEKSISVSNLINGTTRLQPVVLQIGQAAGVMAATAIKQDKEVRDLSVRDIQNAILEAGGYLQPYLDVDKTDPYFKPMQRIGSTGILKGVGMNVEWSNQTWFRADTLLLGNELEGLKEMYPSANSFAYAETPVTVGEAIKLLQEIATSEQIHANIQPMLLEQAQQLGIDMNLDRPILRKEMALFIDTALNPFNRKPVDFNGSFIP